MKQSQNLSHFKRPRNCSKTKEIQDNENSRVLKYLQLQFFNRPICIQKKHIRTTIPIQVWKINTWSKNLHVINEQPNPVINLVLVFV